MRLFFKYQLPTKEFNFFFEIHFKCQKSEQALSLNPHKCMRVGKHMIKVVLGYSVFHPILGEVEVYAM